MPATLAQIDWLRPWFEPLRDFGAVVHRSVAAGSSVAQALNALEVAGAPRFVAPQTQGAEPYEAFVARTACVPTRDNLHDFFNGLVWLRFGPLKRRLNALHAAELARNGVGATRGPARDAVTLFDESGALFAAPDRLIHALQRRDWSELFIGSRSLWQQARLTIVGHAVLEKLVEPRKSITAQVWLGDPTWSNEDGATPVGPDPAARRFAPLPVLGVPAWWPPNESEGFYDDAATFRRAGSLRSKDSARRCRS